MYTTQPRVVVGLARAAASFKFGARGACSSQYTQRVKKEKEKKEALFSVHSTKHAQILERKIIFFKVYFQYTIENMHKCWDENIFYKQFFKS